MTQKNKMMLIVASASPERLRESVPTWRETSGGVCDCDAALKPTEMRAKLDGRNNSPHPDCPNCKGAGVIRTHYPILIILHNRKRVGKQKSLEKFGARVVQHHGWLGHLEAVTIACAQKEARNADILGFLHDDILIHEDGWGTRVLAEFNDPNVVVVGFGGGLAQGHPDIYKIPYELVQLGRSYYISNDDHAEKHGYRFTGSCDAAVLDSYSMFIRREFLDSLGGWPQDFPPNHCLDHWISLSAHKHGKKVRVVGVKTLHKGGGTTVASRDYHAWAQITEWGSDAEMHKQAHRKIYDQFRGVLPVTFPIPQEVQDVIQS